MKRNWIFFVLAMALTVPLAACSPNVPETTTPTPMVTSTPKVTSTPTVTSTPEGVLDDIGEAGKDIADDIGDAAKDVTEDVKNGVKNAVR